MLVAIALIDAGLEPLDAVERVRAKRCVPPVLCTVVCVALVVVGSGGLGSRGQVGVSCWLALLPSFLCCVGLQPRCH